MLSPSAEHFHQPAARDSELVSVTNPFVFIVGCPRSGTTLLQRMLTEHPQLAVSDDIRCIVETIENVYPELKKRRIARGHDPELKPEVADNLLKCKRFDTMRLSEGRVRELAARCTTYAALLSALYDQFAAVHGKPLAGEKTPDYVRRLPMLHGLFPQARFLHIIRDGRDVALSTLEWAAKKRKGPCHFRLWDEHPLATTALWWRWLVRAGRRDGALLGPLLYHEIRYEHLVSDSQAVLRDVCDFLGLPFAEEMLHYYQKHKKRWPGHRHRLPPTVGLRDWTTQMTHRDVELVQLLVGDLLSDLGYACPDTSPDGDIRATAEYCRHWWSLKPSRL
jgi:hypothetical protein